MTMLASFGGGFWSVSYSLFKNDGRVDILDLINGILASLVSVTAGCFLYRAWEAIVVGVIGSILVCFLTPIFDKMGVDDPVGASAVHGLGGIWGVIGKNNLFDKISVVNCETSSQLLDYLLTTQNHWEQRMVELDSSR